MLLSQFDVTWAMRFGSGHRLIFNSLILYRADAVLMAFVFFSP